MIRTLAIFLPFLALAQQPNTTSGPCSPIAPNNSGSVTINCPGLTRQQGEDLLRIVNKILANELDSKAVLAKLDEILHAVNPNLPTKIYFCNGQWRTAGPGANAGLELVLGGDDSVFQNMARLNNARQYPELLEFCLAQIKVAPEWLTPRLFCALAYLGVGERDKAKAFLAEFDSRTGPAYDVDGCKEASTYLHEQLR